MPQKQHASQRAWHCATRLQGGHPTESLHKLYLQNTWELVWLSGRSV